MNPPFKSVFTGGTGRSGTTIVGKLLARHEQVHAGNPYEVKFLTGKGGLLDLVDGALNLNYQSNSMRYQILKSATRSKNIRQSERNLEILSSRICNDWWERKGKRGGTVGLKQGFSLPNLIEEIEKLKSAYKAHPLCSSRKFFYEVVSSHLHFANSTIFVDTTPTNIERSHQIAGLLEGSQFIHMQRGGKDTISSVLSEPWGPKEPLAAIDWWRRKLQLAHQATQRLESEQFLEIKLEDLVVWKRNETYAEVLKFLKIDDEDNMNSYFVQEINPDKAHIDRWKTDGRFDSKFHKEFNYAVLKLQDEGIQAY